MIIDTSAVIAILFAEDDASEYAQAIAAATTCRMSAANYLETCVVIDRAHNPIASRRVDDFMQRAQIVVEPVTKAHADLARAAYRDFGKGAKSRAQLNFGDCFSYALAQATGEPLLFKGDDFLHTDLKVALR